MKLFRRREPKSSHPHAEALQHIANAHRALMRNDAAQGRVHLGKAFAAVHHAMPKSGSTPAPAADMDIVEPDNDPDDILPPQAKSSKAVPPIARLRGFNQK